MTLKKKITEILYKESHDDSECLRIRFENIDKVIDSQEIIADEFAIGFAEWTCGRYIKLHSVWVGIYADQRNKENWKTTKELLEIYKKAQGL